jgi:hypothetical protein
MIIDKSEYYLDCFTVDMPATGKVSLLRQTIYVFIPILDLYAAYHIKKLRWYLLIMILVGFAMSGIASAINPPMTDIDEDRIFTIHGELNWEYLILGENPELTIATTIVYQAVVFGIAVYLIRKWSKQWNMQFD